MVLSPTRGENGERGQPGGKVAAGRVAWLLRAFESRTSQALPTRIRGYLVQTLFSRVATVVTALLMAIVLLGSEVVRHGNRFAVVVTAAEIALLLARCILILLDGRGAEAGIDPSPRIVLFGIAAASSSAFWGIICLLNLALGHDPVLYASSLVVTCGTAGAVAARNSAFPRIALLQMALSLTPALVGCGFADDAGYQVLILIIPLLFIGLRIMVIDRHRQLVELMLSHNELKRLAQTDALTGLPNRRRLDEAQSEEWRRAARMGGPLSLLLLDADRFKSYNDLYGHRKGDQVLIAIAGVLRQVAQRAGDLPARQGGEEFAVLLPDVAHEAAVEIAGRLRAAVQALGLVHTGNEAGVVTVSVGVASSWPKAGQAVADLFENADRALYRAKNAGRNRVES